MIRMSVPVTFRNRTLRCIHSRQYNYNDQEIQAVSHLHIWIQDFLIIQVLLHHHFCQALSTLSEIIVWQGFCERSGLRIAWCHSVFLLFAKVQVQVLCSMSVLSVISCLYTLQMVHSGSREFQICPFCHKSLRDTAVCWGPLIIQWFLCQSVVPTPRTFSKHQQSISVDCLL